MAMKKSVLLCACLTLSVSGFAQDAEASDSPGNINDIKRDTTVVYAEATMKDVIEAQSSACAILEMKIYEWLRNNNRGLSTDSLVNASKDKWFTLVSKRGSYNRAFVYVSKQHILPAPEVAETVAPEPAADEFVPVMEGVMMPELTADEKQMTTITSFYQIEPFIKALQAEGRLRAYGKYSTLPEDGSSHLFIYNKIGEVVAALRRDAEGTHNLKTREADHIDSYHDCGAIWFQTKD